MKDSYIRMLAALVSGIMFCAAVTFLMLQLSLTEELRQAARTGNEVMTEVSAYE